MRELDSAVAETLTGDYWAQTLVSALETQKARAPAALAFRASQILLGARALFSDQLLQNLLDQSQAAGRAAREAHHLFPTNWLRSQGIVDRRRVNQVANLAEAGWHENNAIGSQSPSVYVARLREQLRMDDNQWGRMCAEHALPLGWERMDYDEFLRQRRTRMAELIRVAFRQLGGEPDAPPLAPPWFLPGAEAVWRRIGETERALRALVRDVYATKFGDAAAPTIQAKLPERERETLTRALRTRPPGSDPLTVVDYLYLGQLPALLFGSEVWQHVKSKWNDAADTRQRLQARDFSDRACPKRDRARAGGRAGSSAQGDCSMRGSSGAALTPIWLARCIWDSGLSAAILLRQIDLFFRVLQSPLSLALIGLVLNHGR